MPFFETRKDEKYQSLTCADCGLRYKCITPNMPITGKGHKKIMFMAEAPGQQEDEQGIQLVGKAGKFLRETLLELGIDLEEDCWKTNALNCRPPGNRDPYQNEIDACRKHWINALDKLKPKKLVLLGKYAIESFLGHRMNDLGGLNKWIRWAIPDQDYQLWVYPVYHPSFIMRKQNEKIYQDEFFEQLSFAVDHDEPFPKDKTDIKIVTDLNKAIQCLEQIYRDKPTRLSFDYETTGLKPHRKGHKIVSVSFSDDGEHGVGIKWFDDWRFRDLMQFILKDRDIAKTAHNLKFEETWSRYLVGTPVSNWYWDSMVAAHCLDNRGGISSLKLQTYLNFGVLGYEEEIKPYLEQTKVGEDEKSGNRFNNIEAAPIEKVLHYNALDSIYGWRLSELQRSLMPDRMVRIGYGYSLFLDAIQTFSDIEDNGWLIDEQYYEKALHHLKRTDKRNANDILESDENKLFHGITGYNLRRSNDNDLRRLFFDILKLDPVKYTPNKKKPLPSVDQEAIAQLVDKSEIAAKITATRKNKGLRDKVKGFQREVVNGLIHPNYNLHIPRSYRSSCSSPNMQNIDKRDPVSKMMIRKGIIARPGRVLVARDYSGVEVSTGCFYHKDPVMMNYVKTGAGKMHTDQAIEIFFLDKKQFTKDVKSGKKWAKAIRHLAKNMFVFPQFYGDYYASNAKSIWKEINMQKLVYGEDGYLLIDHLYDNGIECYEDFEKHIKEIEDKFWNRKFTVYRDWKEEHWEDYLRKGYVEMLTGFRCTDILSKNECINRPVQGTAFHLLLWALIKTHKELKADNWKSFLIGQIHDDMLADCDESEVEDYVKLTDRIETADIVKHWPWINVPLIVETEASGVDGNWHSMKEIENA